MFLAVIRHGVRLLRDRYRHFGRGRSDRQLAFGLLDIVVVCIELFAFRVGDRVRHFTFGNIRHAASRLDIRHFAGNKAVAANRHVRLRQRCAVVNLASALARQRHHALLDLELAVVHNKLNIRVREVVVLVLKLALVQTHVVGARVGGLHLCLAGKREVVFRVQIVVDRHSVVLRGLLASVIRLGNLVARDRYRHFGRGRSDRQLALGLLDIVVVCIELFAFRVGDRVRHFTFGNIRHAASRLDIRHFTGNKAVARNLHNRLCQRRAVVRLAGRFGGQHHIALVDRQRSRIRRRNDILFCRVNLVQRITRFSFILFKIDRISSSIRSRHARCGKAFKGNAFRRSGKAGNALLRSIISLLVAVRRQLDVLIIVEIDYVFVRVSLNRDLLGISRYRRVAIDRNGGFCHGFAERLSFSFRICNFSRCSVQIIVYRVSGGVLFIVERQLALVFCEIDGLLLRMTFYKIERIEIFLPGIRRCDLFGGLPHKA